MAEKNTKAQRSGIKLLVGDEMRTPWFTLERRRVRGPRARHSNSRAKVLMRNRCSGACVSDAGSGAGATGRASHVDRRTARSMFVRAGIATARDGSKSAGAEQNAAGTRACSCALLVSSSSKPPQYQHPLARRTGNSVLLVRTLVAEDVRTLRALPRSGLAETIDLELGRRSSLARCVPGSKPAPEAG